MKKFVFSISLLVLVIGCTRMLPEQPNVSDIQLNLPETPYEYNYINTPNGKVAVLYEDSSLINNNKATIGRVLFYDKALSFNNSTACASCHIQGNGFSDLNQFSVGFEGKTTKRNSMPISNLFDNRHTGYFWDTRESKIEQMVFAPIQDHIEMGFSQINVITEKLNNLKYYKNLFKTTYGDETISTDRMRECLSQFLYSIVNKNTKFDQGLRTNFSNFSPNETRGMELFKLLECNSCHFLDAKFSPEGAKREKFANVGLDAENIDPGKDGLYRIPDLRNIALTAPYMHDGRFNSLSDVINHYGSGIQKNPNLSDELKEKKTNLIDSYYGTKRADIIAFLNTLTDQVTTKDAKYSNPFEN